MSFLGFVVVEGEVKMDQVKVSAVLCSIGQHPLAAKRYNVYKTLVHWLPLYMS